MRCLQRFMVAAPAARCGRRTSPSACLYLAIASGAILKGFPSMVSRIFWLPCETAGRVAILSRPASERLTDEATAWREAGVSIVVSLLEPHEQAELGLLREAEQCRAQAIEFVSFPIADRGLPASRQDVVTLAHRLAGTVERGSSVGVHCRAGIGRSAIMAASILMALGRSADGALELITEARGVSVPDTSEQREWIRSMGASLCDAKVRRDATPIESGG